MNRRGWIWCVYSLFKKRVVYGIASVKDVFEFGQDCSARLLVVEDRFVAMLYDIYLE